VIDNGDMPKCFRQASSAAFDDKISHMFNGIKENSFTTRFHFLHFFQMMSSEHLTCGWLQQLLVVLLKLCLTFAGPLRPLNGTDCSAKGPASYILVFTGHWSPQAFPKQYPLFRPPAQWSKLIGEKNSQGQRS